MNKTFWYFKEYNDFEKMFGVRKYRPKWILVHNYKPVAEFRIKE